MMIRTGWVVAVALAVAAPRTAGGQAPAPAARDTGLIVGSVEAAIRQPAPRLDRFNLVVDLSDRRLYVLDGENVVRTWPVSVGEEGYATPAGSFTIRRMIWNPSWTPPNSAWARNKTYEAPGSPGNPMGRVKIFFREPDYYIHGTGLASSLGNARSHGCIRMRNIDAVELARWIMINAGEDANQSWYQQTIGNPTTSREVSLDRPITIRVRA
jgi:lipoprotein-anchoring transpeptidase ErfK/SrfK